MFNFMTLLKSNGKKKHFVNTAFSQLTIHLSVEPPNILVHIVRMEQVFLNDK